MSLGKIVWYLALLIIPCCTFLLGLKRKSSCAVIRAPFGYSSELSLTNETLWATAQKLCSKRYLVVSIILAVFSLWFYTILPAETMAQLSVSGITVVMFQMVVMIFVIATVEVSLRNVLHPKQKKAKKSA